MLKLWAHLMTAVQKWLPRVTSSKTDLLATYNAKYETVGLVGGCFDRAAHGSSDISVCPGAGSLDQLVPDSWCLLQHT